METRTTSSRGIRSRGLRIGYLIVLDMLVYIACLAGIYRVALQPGLGVTLGAVDEGFVVRRAMPDRTGEGLRQGEIITSVDGHRINDVIVLEAILDGHAVGDTIQVGVAAGGAGAIRSIVLGHEYGMAYLITIAIVGTIFFLIGLFVALKRPGDTSALVFHMAMNSAALMIMGVMGRYPIDPPAIDHGAQIIFTIVQALNAKTIGYALNAPLFIHFTLLFPRPKWIGHHRRLMIPLYLSAIGLALLSGSAFAAGTWPQTDLKWLEIHATSVSIIQTMYLLGSLAAVANFVHSYKTTLDEIERRKLRWTLLGASAGPLIFIMLWLIPDRLGIDRPVSEEVMLILSAITPITFAIAIVRHRLMDIDAILGRSTAYAVVLGTLLVVYAVIVRIAAKSVLGTMIDQSEIQALAAVALALLFEPARTRVQRFVDRRFFRVRYNFREAQRDLSDRINHTIELRRLGGIVIDGLDALLLTERIAFFILAPGRESMTTLAHRGFERKAWKSIAFDAVLRSGREGKPMTLPELIEPGADYIEFDRPIYSTHGIALFVSVATMIPDTIALLVLGPKKSGTRFSAEDLDLITTTTIQAAAAVERITLQHDLVLEQAESLRLKELNRLKSFFVSSVSHELKTPLTSIRMFAELLQSGTMIPVEKVTRYAGTIEAESNRLARLIDNVLDFSKIERGVKEYRFSSLELNSTVERVIDSLSYQITTSGFQIELDLDPGLIELHADSDAVTAAVVNLISNAIKYSSETREITVRTAMHNGFAEVAVTDRGIGISEADRARIFDAFYRSNDPAACSVAGTGLGLALVHHVVTAHGGRIEVRSVPCEGSTFTLLFPLLSPPAAPATGAGESQARNGGSDTALENRIGSTA